MFRWGKHARGTYGQIHAPARLCKHSADRIVAGAAGAEAPRLKVSPNGRFLVYADGRPFFYLGDTAWELFHRLNREEADRYLGDRASKGFTVIQAVALAELDGLNAPNPYGHRPLIDNDPAKPDVKDGPANDYWDHVDYIVDRATSLGLFIGFLPTWGDKWNKKWGVGPEIFTPDKAEAYGKWIGRRYRDKPVIWILGGDRPIENDTQREIVRRMGWDCTRGMAASISTPFIRRAARVPRPTSTTPSGWTSTCARTAM